MLESIRIRGYRGFADFKAEGFSRVNLLVGKNNTGKTALLEAVEFLASCGDLSRLMSCARRRGELSWDRDSNPSFADMSHLFHGHVFGPDTKIAIHSGGKYEWVEVSVQTEFPSGSAPTMFGEILEDGPVFGLVSRGPTVRDGMQPLLVTADGAVTQSQIGSPLHFYQSMSSKPVFITPDSLQPSSMTAMWHNVIRDTREKDVYRALRILEPRIHDIAFLSGGERPHRPPRPTSILMGLEGEPRRVPLGSAGDGMRRLLALSLSLIEASGSMLLVDEIDTGFHYSIMSDMWKLVANTAREMDIQVFATTHSLDCVKGLAWLCEDQPELAKDVSLHRIESGFDESIAHSGPEIVDAIDMNLEVR